MRRDLPYFPIRQPHSSENRVLLYRFMWCEQLKFETVNSKHMQCTIQDWIMIPRLTNFSFSTYRFHFAKSYFNFNILYKVPNLLVLCSRVVIFLQVRMKLICMLVICVLRHQFLLTSKAELPHSVSACILHIVVCTTLVCQTKVNSSKTQRNAASACGNGINAP